MIRGTGGAKRGLPIIELGEGPLGIRIEESLLVNPSHSFQRADVKRIPRAAVAGALTFELAMCSLSVFAFSSAATCASVSTKPSCALLASRTLPSDTADGVTHFVVPCADFVNPAWPLLIL